MPPTSAPRSLGKPDHFEKTSKFKTDRTVQALLEVFSMYGVWSCQVRGVKPLILSAPKMSRH